MRVWLTGASGFVGSNLEAVLAERGDELACPRHSEVDVTDNDLTELSQRRAAAWAAAGEPFTVWEADDINLVATPTLATDAARLIRRIAELRATGIFHCCGGEHATRAELARGAAAALGAELPSLDEQLARLREELCVTT